MMVNAKKKNNSKGLEKAEVDMEIATHKGR